MKTTIIHLATFSIFFLFATDNLMGQNYQTVHFDREAYFESEEFGLHWEGESLCSSCRFGIRVKEVVATNQYVFPTYWSTGIVPDGEARFSWLGDTLKLLPDGTEIFRNKHEELITIKPQMGLGGSWSMFDIEGIGYLEARVTENTFIDVFGLMDSVKTIVIQAKDFNDENIDHEMNGFSIQIGKNTGFIETLDLFHFPKRMEKVFLIGKSNPAVGEELLNAKSIYDFQVGDERIYINTPEYEVEVFEKITVLEREDVNADSIRYLFNFHYVTAISSYNDVTNMVEVEYEHEVWDQSYGYNVADDHPINTHPYEKISEPLAVNDRFNFIEKNTNGEWIKSIYTDPINLFFNSSSIYQDCLGERYNSYNESFNFSIRSLIYYKKGNIEWGNYIDFETLTPTEEIQEQGVPFTIYPNPTIDNITIVNEKIQHIKVLNNLGQGIADWSFNGQDKVTKSVSDFSPGLYWLMVANEDGKVGRLNFVKTK